jgi:DNA-binding MarR family transcriptional regulator
MQTEHPSSRLKAVSSTPCVCATLRKASRIITLMYDEFLRPSGLRVTQYSLLKNVLARQPVTVNHLAEATVTDRTTLTRNLRILAQGGFIRIREGEDRREREVTLTPRGRDALAKAGPCWERAQANVLARLGEDRWKALREELGAMIELGRRR